MFESFKKGFYLECMDHYAICGSEGHLKHINQTMFVFNCQYCGENFTDEDDNIWMAITKWNILQRKLKKEMQ